MTRRSKMLLVSSSLLAACIIATSVLLIITTSHDALAQTTIILAGGVIAASLLSVAFIYWLKVRRTADEKKLNKSYLQAYEIIKDTITNAPIPNGLKRSVVIDVLELLLTAQNHGKSSYDSIGDARVFAQNILAACISKPRTVIVSLIDSIMAFLLFTILAQMLMWIENPTDNFFGHAIDTTMIVFFAFVAGGVIPLTRYWVNRKSIWAYLLPVTSGILFIGIIELLRLVFAQSKTVLSFLNSSLMLIPNLPVLALVIALISVLFMLRLRIRHMSVK